MKKRTKDPNDEFGAQAMTSLGAKLIAAEQDGTIVRPVLTATDHICIANLLADEAAGEKRAKNYDEAIHLMRLAIKHLDAATPGGPSDAD